MSRKVATPPVSLGKKLRFWKKKPATEKAGAAAPSVSLKPI